MAALRNREVSATELGPVLVLSATLLVGWAVWATLLYPGFAGGALSERPLVGVVARTVFWLFPCGVYLHRYWGKRWPEPIGFGFPKGAPQIARTLILTLGVSALFVLGTRTQQGMSAEQILTRLLEAERPSLTAPIFEELVFRGVVLAELINWARDSSRDLPTLRLKFWGVMLLGALIFVAVHWPFWVAHFAWSGALERSLPLFAFSLIVSFVYANCRSIWACIWLHFLNNQLSIL